LELIYQNIAVDMSAPLEVRARALPRLAECEKKLGACPRFPSPAARSTSPIYLQFPANDRSEETWRERLKKKAAFKFVAKRVRRAVLVEGKSRQAVNREFGLARKTIGKMLKYSLPQ
jgi:hypothetical protein